MLKRPSPDSTSNENTSDINQVISQKEFAYKEEASETQSTLEEVADLKEEEPETISDEVDVSVETKVAETETATSDQNEVSKVRCHLKIFKNKKISNFYKFRKMRNLKVVLLKHQLILIKLKIKLKMIKRIF